MAAPVLRHTAVALLLPWVDLALELKCVQDEAELLERLVEGKNACVKARCIAAHIVPKAIRCRSSDVPPVMVSKYVVRNGECCAMYNTHLFVGRKVVSCEVNLHSCLSPAVRDLRRPPNEHRRNPGIGDASIGDLRAKYR